jgi:hypothetical protein
VTTGGLILLAFFALGAAQAYERVYELAWRLKAPHSRSWSRQLRWVAALLAYVAALAGAVPLRRTTVRGNPAQLTLMISPPRG